MAEANIPQNRPSLPQSVTTAQAYACTAAIIVTMVTGFVGVILSSSKEVAVMQTEILALQNQNRQQGAENNTQNSAIVDLQQRVTVIEVFGGRDLAFPENE